MPTYLIYNLFFSFQIKVGSGSRSGSDLFSQLSWIGGKKFRILIPVVISYFLLYIFYATFLFADDSGLQLADFPTLVAPYLLATVARGTS